MKRTTEEWIAHRHLIKIMTIDELINRYTEVYDEQYALVHSIKSPSFDDVSRGTAEEDRLGAAITKLIELEELINTNIEELVSLKADTLRKLQMMANLDERNMLIARYVQCKKLDEIAEETGKERKCVNRKINNGLSSYYKLFLQNGTKGDRQVLNGTCE